MNDESSNDNKAKRQVHTYRDAGKILGMGPELLKELIKDGSIARINTAPKSWVRPRLRITQQAIDDFLESRKVPYVTQEVKPRRYKKRERLKAYPIDWDE